MMTMMMTSVLCIYLPYVAYVSQSTAASSAVSRRCRLADVRSSQRAGFPDNVRHCLDIATVTHHIVCQTQI